VARSNLAVNELTRAGVAPAAETTGDPVNNHSLGNDGATFLLVRNAHATVAQTLTVHFTKTIDGQAVTARTISVPATTSRYIGPFPVADYGTVVGIDVSTSDLKLSAYHVSR
jgi:hypothetical protein